MYFQYSGYAYSGRISYVGSYGYYWSSTPRGSDSAYFLYLDSGNANPSNGGYSRYNGFPVRCLVKTNSDDFWEPASFTL